METKQPKSKNLKTFGQKEGTLPQKKRRNSRLGNDREAGERKRIGRTIAF